MAPPPPRRHTGENAGPGPTDDIARERLHELLAVASVGARSILDAGCGRGSHLAGTAGGALLVDLRREGCRIAGVDVVDDVHQNPFVTEAHVVDPTASWPVPRDAFDVVFCDWVLEHVEDPRAFVGECARVLRPGGHLVARTLQRWSVAGIGAALIPNRLHPRLVGLVQPGMSADDVFPTVLRANTGRVLRRLCREVGLEPAIEQHLGLGGYDFGRPRVGACLGAIERRAPRAMRHALIVCAVKAHPQSTAGEVVEA